MMRNQDRRQRPTRRKLAPPQSDSARPRKRTQWLTENAAGIDAYNAYVDKHGTFAEALRAF